MSRVGKRPILLAEGISLTKNKNTLSISSSNGEKVFEVPSSIKVEQVNRNIFVTRESNCKIDRSLHGLYARLISNAVIGLSKGISKKLDFKGTGYRAKVESNKIILSMGYSHDVTLEIPESLIVTVNKNSIVITGTCAEKVGNFAATIRQVRKPEVYKGKGIKYDTEIIKRKDGKAAQGGKA